MKIPVPRTLTLAMLAASVAVSGAAWAMQNDAAGALERAHEIQQERVPEDDSPPPDLDDYRAILDTIERSVAIRQEIGGVLGRIEAMVASFGEQQDAADAITSGTAFDLAAIGRSLSSAGRAARLSKDELSSLQEGLARSARLARLIADELEELDESLGPSAGGP